MFGLGTTEVMIILGLGVLVFGASRLPALGRGLGEGMRGFKEGLKGEADPKERQKELESGDDKHDDQSNGASA